MEEITSVQNSKIKYLARLGKESALRRESGLFLAEGEKLLLQAKQAGCKPDQLFLTARTLHLAAQFPKTPVFCIDDRCAEKISTMPSPPDCFGTFYRPVFSETVFSTPGRFLALDNIQDPGNLGTILRTALAFGASGAILGGESGDLFSPKALRASMGAALSLPVLRTDCLADTLSALQKKGFRLLVTALQEASVLLPKVRREPPFVLVIGNEGHGVSDAVLRLADQTVYIPMASGIQSLNAASAASIALYELLMREGGAQ